MIAREGLQKRFRVFIFLSSFILLMEVAGSIFTKSLALLSDAGHVLVDLLAMLLTYFQSGYRRKRPPTSFPMVITGERFFQPLSMGWLWS